MSKKSNVRALAGRVGGLVTASRYDGRALTQAARGAFLQRFEEQVDPEGRLPAVERARRAQLARRAHFARLAMKSAQARRRASSRKGGAA